jgi:fumarate hydratase class II
VIIHNVLTAGRLLADVCHSFVDHCIAEMTVNRARIAELVDRSLMLVTALAPAIGYDKAAHLAHVALEDDLTLREANRRLGYLAEAEFDRLIDPAKMVHP